MFYGCCLSLKASGQARFKYMQFNENVNTVRVFSYSLANLRK